jgi:hypothetical protein
MRPKSSTALAGRPATKPPKRSAGALAKVVRELIEQPRAGVARTVDSGLVTLYLHVGRRIREDVLKARRAEYGEKMVSALRTLLGWTHFRQIIALDDPLKRDAHARTLPGSTA